ncbi:pilus assembly protein CpaF [Lachnospiraceae bacterium PM6-15]|uniref:CpaF family protein n=1 Tax=Ohessyouella blattaphilus TaxID=2949333 RepID=A0ABT1EL87_9FIRM|nr:CpaF family protein [Ohessyouella blattaphilus]MCP1110027.1 CpaF family protein [Ohessyouella blattaphilus]MCR8563421.1 CpaF family protein [Ohessyouella blattaphilus]
MNRFEILHEKILGEIDLTQEFDDQELVRLIHKVIKEHTQNDYMAIDERTALGKELFNTLRKLDVLEDFLHDEAITEIMINGTQNIFYEREGRLYDSKKRFSSTERLNDLIQQIVSQTNRLVNESSPIVDTRLADGSRVNVVLSPIALDGPVVTIRKFSKAGMNLKELIRRGSVSEDIVHFLSILVAARYNIFISGGTGSGKTTFLNALAETIPKDERLIIIEDNAELNIRSLPNLVRLEARGANTEGKGEIPIHTLIKTALRMRPDRIIIGEVRGEEALSLLQAYNTGHDGSISTGHANSCMDMIARLETMVLMNKMEMPLQAIRRQIASGIDIFIHLGRLRDKSRKVLEVSEVKEYKNEEIVLNVLYEYREEGYGQGSWTKVNDIYHTEKLLAAGYQL